MRVFCLSSALREECKRSTEWADQDLDPIYFTTRRSPLCFPSLSCASHLRLLGITFIFSSFARSLHLSGIFRSKIKSKCIVEIHCIAFIISTIGIKEISPLSLVCRGLQLDTPHCWWPFCGQFRILKHEFRLVSDPSQHFLGCETEDWGKCESLSWRWVMMTLEVSWVLGFIGTRVTNVQISPMGWCGLFSRLTKAAPGVTPSHVGGSESWSEPDYSVPVITRYLFLITQSWPANLIPWTVAKILWR